MAQPVRALLGADDFAAQAAGLAQTLAAAGPLPLAAGGLAAAGLASLVPPPPTGLREPVSVSLEDGKAPLNTVRRSGRGLEERYASCCRAAFGPCPQPTSAPTRGSNQLQLPNRSTVWGAAASSLLSKARC